MINKPQVRREHLSLLERGSLIGKSVENGTEDPASKQERCRKRMGSISGEDCFGRVGGRRKRFWKGKIRKRKR